MERRILGNPSKRFKWQKESLNLKVGEIVLVKSKNTSPTKWPLGRIKETHPGVDGKVRVISIKTQNGVIKTPIHKICQLKTNKEENKVIHRTELSTSVIMISCLLILTLMNNIVSLNTTKLDQVQVTPIDKDAMIFINVQGKLDTI